MAVRHGEQIIVYTQDGSAAAIAIPKQRSAELTRTLEMREKASNDANSQEFTPGREGWVLTVSGLMSSYSNPIKYSEPYTIVIDYGGTTETGQAWCSQVKITATVDTLVQQSAVFTGTGPLTQGSSEE